ncbi:MAG: hypothetical protein A2287_10040 [Candidatus Melainabacteria bacterium RIFOXYA12_FULL_32_12]|nr:MAG: hypothetical protein A2287_10040 [Candidatus Melainabacteria bacterium RIFOXYA12_FULL_32_12]
MNILGFLNNLRNITNNSYVGISVSPNSVLEVAQFNSETREILKYGKTDLSYELVTRQISNIGLLESKIQKLYAELEIPTNSPAVLTLPTVLMNHQTLPLQLEPEEIKTALISETERYYIFKRSEPLVSWNRFSSNDNDTQSLIYSAIQKEQVDQIEEISHKSGLNIVAIESSYAALIRGLIVTDIPEAEITENKPWCALIITPNSFVLISLEGNKIIQVSEEPLAVKSFNPEDIYPNIASLSMGSTLSKNPEHIVIISKSDDVSAQVLSTYLDLTCKVSFIEENQYNKMPLFKGNINVSTTSSNIISLESVGSTCWDAEDFPVNFNFLNKDGVGSGAGFKLTILGKSFILTSTLAEYMLIGLIAFTFIILASTYMICLSINGSLEKAYRESFTKLSKIEESKQESTENQSQPTQINANELLYSVYDKNKKILQSYNAISEVIPEKLWIEYFELHDNLATSVKGKAYSVEDIVNYYQSLNKTAKFENFKIASIKIVNQNSTPETSNSEVTIVPSSTNGMDLPSLPGLPTLSSQKYYEFVFGKEKAPETSKTEGRPTDIK